MIFNFLSCKTLHSFQLGSNVLWDLVLPHSGVTNDDVGHPDEEERNDCHEVKVDTEERKGDNSEADGMEEEGKVTPYKIQVSFGRLEVSELSNVHVEKVDLNCTTQNVYNGKAEGPQRNAEERNLVIKSVRNARNIDNR